jgi:hypothetical protein
MNTELEGGILIMFSEGMLKESYIVGTGVEIAVYLKDVIKGLETNMTLYHMRFVLGIDPNVLDMIEDLDKKPRLNKVVLGLVFGFMIGVLFSMAVLP